MLRRASFVGGSGEPRREGGGENGVEGTGGFGERTKNSYSEKRSREYDHNPGEREKGGKSSKRQSAGSMGCSSPRAGGYIGVDDVCGVDRKDGTWFTTLSGIGLRRSVWRFGPASGPGSPIQKNKTLCYYVM